MASRFFLRFAATLAAVGLAATCSAQTSAFSYQGRLNRDGTPASGIYDFQFKICDALTGGAVVAGPLSTAPVLVTNGLFTVTLDAGAAAFSGG